MTMEFKPLDIQDLYFGVLIHPLSYGSPSDRQNLKTYNLFDLGDIRANAAIYRAEIATGERESLRDPLMTIFDPVWSKTEFEVMICPWPFKEKDKVKDVGNKVSIYNGYVVPNRELLLAMVNAVTLESAKKYAAKCRAEWRKLYRA